MELKEIAVIHTDFPEKFGIPRQSGLVGGLQGTIVFPRNAEMLMPSEGLMTSPTSGLYGDFPKQKKITGLPPSDRRGSVEKCVWVFLQHAPLSVLTRLVCLP